MSEDRQERLAAYLDALVRFVISPLFHQPASADFRAAVMDCAKVDVAYEMPLTSKYPYKFWPAGAISLCTG